MALVVDGIGIASTAYVALKFASCCCFSGLCKNQQSDARLRAQRPQPNEKPHAHLLERYALSTRGNLYLNRRQWKAEKPNGCAVVIVHGFTEHIARYGNMAAALNAAGFDVYGMDLPGHGGSEGDRCFFESIGDVVDDVLQHVRDISGPSGRKVLAIGHSLGGLLLALCGLKAPELFQGIVLSGPSVWLDPKSQGCLMGAFRCAGGLMPKLYVSGGGTPPALCSTEAVVQSYHLDPMCPTTGVPLGTMKQMLGGMEYFMKNVGSFSPPLLLQHGTKDNAIPAEASEWMFAGVASTKKDKLLYEGWLHEPYNECAPECGVERDPTTGVTTNRAVRDAITWLSDRASEP